MATPDYIGAYNKLFPRKMSTNAFLTIYVLHILSAKSELMYGKEIIDRIEARFNGIFKPSHGLMYPILRKLEEQGMLDAHWEGNDDKKTRRYYQITDVGREALEKESVDFKPMFLQSYMLFAGIMKDLYEVQKNAKH